MSRDGDDDDDDDDDDDEMTMNSPMLFSKTINVTVSQSVSQIFPLPNQQFKC